MTRMDLDTEDRVDRYKLAMTAVMDLVDGQDPLNKIQAHPFGMLLHLLHDEFERALPTTRFPPRAIND